MSGSTQAGKSEGSGGNPSAAGWGNTADSYNATNNSYNTADNRHVYRDSQHNEVNSPGSTINMRNKHKTINVWNRNTASTPEDWEELKRLVDTDGDWDLLLGHLTIADQDVHRCNIQLDWNEPKYFWITKNIDFTQWRSVDGFQALHICGPHHRGIKEVASHIVDRAKEAAMESGGIALYYFSSTAPADQAPSSFFAHTLLRQIVTHVESGKANSTAAVFLRTLFRGLYWKNLLRFRKGEPLSAAVRTALDLPGLEDLWGVALVEAIREAHVRISSITIEMVDDDVLFRNIIVVAKHVMAADTVVKVLLLGPLSGEHFSDSLEFLTRIEYDTERKECLRSLRYSDTRYDNVSEEHHGSLEWLWNHPEYLKWSSSTASSLLYIEGKPGSGKSTLAKYFAKNLRAKEPSASTTGSTVVHYFYTLRGTEHESTHENMLRSILHGLLDNDETAFFHFQRQYRETRASGEWTYASLKPVLSSFANHPPEKPVYLILDAMDESTEDDRQDIVRLLCNLCSTNNPCNIKVFLASRPVAQLQDHIENIIRLQDENKRDIQAFVNSFLGELKLTGPIIDEATRYIIANAEGVFVWVSLVRGELVRITAAGYNNREIMDHLRGLPKELQEFYELMLERLQKGSSVDIRDGITLFQFVRFSNRPMQATELQHVLAIQPYSDGPKLSTISPTEFKERLTGSIEARIAHCGGGFLEITANNTVQLMHQTAQEFFLKIERKKRISDFALDSDKAHRTITMALVAYLVTCFTNLRFSKIITWDSEDLRLYARYLGEWRLLGYAIPNLKPHYELCSDRATVKGRISTLIENLNRQLCSRFLGDWFADQFGRMNPGRRIRRALANATLRSLAASDRQTPEELSYKILDAVAAQGPNWVFEMMVNPCTHFEVRARNETPLIACVRRELVDASRMCLSSGVDVDAKGIKGRTALHQAAKKGNNDIVAILLMGNANKRIKDDNGHEALQLALKKFPVDLKGRQIGFNYRGERGGVYLDDGYDVDYDGRGYRRYYGYVDDDDRLVKLVLDLPPVIRSFVTQL